MGELEIRGNTLVVRSDLTWEFEAEFDTLAKDLLAATGSELVLDLAAADFLASPFVGRVLRLHEAAAKRGKVLKVVVSSRLKELFETAGVASALRVELADD